MRNREAIQGLIKLKDKADSYEKKCINKAIEALEKQIPKKPILMGQTISWWECCPTCGEVVVPLKSKWCDCGQCLDWSSYK